MKLQKLSLSLMLMASPLVCGAANIAESVFTIANDGTDNSVAYLSFSLPHDSLIDIATSSLGADSVIYLLNGGSSDFGLSDFLAASDDGCQPIDCGSSPLFNNSLIDNKALAAGDYTVALSSWPFEPEEAISGLNPDNETASEILVVVGDENLVIPGTGTGTGSQLLLGFNRPGFNANDIATVVAINQACNSASAGQLHEVCNELNKLTGEQLRSAIEAISPSRNSTTINGLAVETAQPVSSGVQVRLSRLQTGAQRYGGLSVNGFDDDFGGQLAAGDELPSIFKRLGFFVNATGHFGSKKVGINESGYNYEAGGITLGTDYALTENFLLGVAFNYEHNDVSLKSLGGKLQTDSYAGSFYSVFNKGDFYVDGIFSIGGMDYQTERNIVYTTLTDTVNDVAKGNNDGIRYELNLNGGYVFAIDGLTINPYVGFDYSKTTVQAYDETGGGAWGVHFDRQDIESIESALGLRSSYALSTDIGVFVPQVSMEWGHEFGNNQQRQTARFIQDSSGAVIYMTSDKPDRDYMRVGFDVSGHFAHDVSAFFSYQALVLMADVDSHIVTGGIRMQF